MDEAKKYMLVAILCDFATDYEHKFYPTTPIRHANDLHDFVEYWIEINNSCLADMGLKGDILDFEFGCSIPVNFVTSEGIKTCVPGKSYDENLKER